MAADPIVRADVTAASIDAAALSALVASPRAGAVATFEGTVRDHHQGKAVSHLEYEAYVPMAERELRRVLEEAAERWPVERIAARHRVGRLEIGEVAVAIAVSAAHRDACLEALRFTIDTLKKTVPIWKRESGPDGSFWIEGPEQVALDS